MGFEPTDPWYKHGSLVFGDETNRPLWQPPQLNPNCGARAAGIRTSDLLVGGQALFPLSYARITTLSRMGTHFSVATHPCLMVGPPPFLVHSA